MIEARLRRAAGDAISRRDRAAGDLGRRRRGAAPRAAPSPRRHRVRALAAPAPADAPCRAAEPPCARRHRSRSSTPRAPPARPRACSARTRSTTGGACTARASSASAPTTCSARRCRCSTSTRSTPSRRPRWPAPASAFEPRFSASALLARRCGARGATVVYLLGAMVPILLAQPASAAERAHRVRIGLGPGVPASAARGVPRAHRRARCSKATARPRPTSSSHRARRSPRRGVMGWLRPGFDARVVDAHDVELPAGEAGELVLRADEPFAFASGYFGKPEADRRGLAQPLVPHRRPRGARGRRRVPLRRPHQGRDPPPRREHLVVRGRAGAAGPSGGGRGGGLSRCAPSWPRTR